MSQFINHSLLQILHSGNLVITANERQGRFLRREYAKAVTDGIFPHQATLNVTSYNGWLQSVWALFMSMIEDDSQQPSLINSRQSQLVWEFLAGKVNEFDSVVLKTASSALAGQANSLINEWELDSEDARFSQTVDTSLFSEWRKLYLGHVDYNRWIDISSLPDLVRELFHKSIIPAPNEIHFYHFAEFTPQQQSLFDEMSRKGSQLVRVDREPICKTICRTSLKTVEDEIKAAAQWARSVLELDPNAKVGIVAPALEDCADTVVRVFDQVFDPSSVMKPLANMARPYNISLGKALIDQPVICRALDIISMAQGYLTVEEWVLFLHSPFVRGADAEFLNRTVFAQKIRASGFHTITLSEIIEFLSSEEDEEFSCPILIEVLTAFTESRDAVYQDMRPSDWVTRFDSMLESVGWPGNRQLTSTEYQTVEAWKKSLPDFEALGMVKGHVSFLEAVTYINRVARETIFQPQSPDTPVDIMGTLEAEGLSFDYLWLMGMNDTSWPLPSKPNPLIPIVMQREKNIARSSPEREFTFSKLITDSLVNQSLNVVVSYPETDGDVSCRISSLFVEHDHIDSEELTGAIVPFYSESLVGTAHLEVIDDHIAPPVESGVIIEGGVSIIKHQSACPFRAFAEHRLGARPIEPVDDLLSPAERGELLHRVLELFWKQTTSQASMLALSDIQLLKRVDECVVQSLDELDSKRPRLLRGAYRELEKERLTSLCSAWLEADAKRAPFTQVITEKRSTVTIGGMELRVRIDRQDVLEDGSVAITDYKSGDPSVSGWFGDRPDEPQLPLYAAMYKGRTDIGAVLFGGLKSGSVGYKGIVKEAGILNEKSKAFEESRESKHAEQWDQIVPAWSDTVHRLANDYRQGVADVSPKHPVKSCEYCPMASLCRVAENRAA
ncbi:MAG TPA: hypothetical protein ENI05_13265 [Porticoccus sp.]|nr:hypothetical protein [Porticoccus sp.]